MIGEWSSIRLQNESRAALFKMVVEGLSPSEHLAVRLMAARVVKSTVDIFEFRIDDIVPVAPAIFQGLLQLILECASSDSQVTILTSLNITLERLEAHVQPFVDLLLQCLSTLWRDSDANYLVQCGIVSALKTAVKSLKRDAAKIEAFACELVAISTDLTNPLSVHLITGMAVNCWVVLEDGKCGRTLKLGPHLLSFREALLHLLDSQPSSAKEASVPVRPQICSQTNKLTLTHYSKFGQPKQWTPRFARRDSSK